MIDMQALLDAIRVIIREELAGTGQELGVPAYARQHGCSTATVFRWIRRGEIPATRVGARWKIPADAVPPGRQRAPRKTGGRDA